MVWGVFVFTIPFFMFCMLGAKAFFGVGFVDVVEGKGKKR